MLRRQFQQFWYSTQSNEGGRLSLAKSKWSEVKHFLRVNAELHRDRQMSEPTASGATGLLSPGGMQGIGGNAFVTPARMNITTMLDLPAAGR